MRGGVSLLLSAIFFSLLSSAGGVVVVVVVGPPPSLVVEGYVASRGQATQAGASSPLTIDT